MAKAGRSKPQLLKSGKSAPRSLLDIPKSWLLKQAKAAGPPTPEQQQQFANTLYWSFIEPVTRVEFKELRVPRLAADKPAPPDKPDKPAPQERHAPRSTPAIALLKHIYPLDDGRPSKEKVPNSKLKSDYHDECKRRGISQKDRLSDSQLLRCVDRKKKR